MIAVDTNILVYAHRTDSPFHAVAGRKITELAEGAGPWAIPWPCVHELLAVVTNSRIFQPPTAPEIAVDYLDGLFQAPNLALLAETELHWSTLRPLITAARTVGGRVHDARIAAICMQHGVTELGRSIATSAAFPNLRSSTRSCRNR